MTDELEILKLKAEISRNEVRLAELRIQDKNTVVLEREPEKQKGKEKEKEHVSSDKGTKRKRNSKNTSSSEPEKKRSRFGVSVINPLTKRPITFGDLSHERNRVMFNFIKKVRDDSTGELGLRDALVDMVRQALQKGFKQPFYNPHALPKGVLDEATANLREQLGDDRYEEEISTDSDPVTHDSWHNEFFHQVITSDTWPGDSFQSDLAHIRIAMEKELKAHLGRLKRLRFSATYRCLMAKTRQNLVRGATTEANHMEEVEETRVANIRSGYLQQINMQSDIAEAVDSIFFVFDSEIDKHTEHGSGYKWIKSIELEISVSKFIVGMGRNNRTHSIQFEGPAEMKGGKWIKLPRWLRTRQVINPKRNKSDQGCFVWCILRALHPPIQGQKAGNVQDLEKRFDEIHLPPSTQFPVECTARMMRKVEELNDFSLSVFLLGSKEYDVRPLYVTRKRKAKHIRLGIIEKDEAMHYVLLPELSRIVKPWGKTNHKAYFCENCFSPHVDEKWLQFHEEECFANEPTRIIMPKAGTKDHTITFSQWRYKLPAPFVVYADFEALLKEPRPTAKPNVFSRHKPVAWAYHIECYYPQHKLLLGANGQPLGRMRSFCGKNAVHELLESLAEDAEVCQGIVNSLENIKYRGEIPAEYHTATHCHICGKEGFDDVDIKRKRVLDHDHITGLYRGAAHHSCNFQYYSTKNWRLPVLFHNLKGYDGYHIIKGLEGYIDGIEEMNCIARSLDKFTSFTIDNLRFIDSMQFLLGSLDANVEGLKKGLSLPEMKEAFRPVVDHFKIGQDDYRFSLLMGKGIYPYEYMKDIHVMKETTLPPKEAFFSNLHNAGIKDTDYQRAQECFQAFDCQDLEDYTMLYVKLDVLQLASCFEKLRKTCLAPDSIQLDPAHFITAPSLSWSAMLLNNFRNDIVIENQTDLEMMLMTQKGVRGGLCMVMDPRFEKTPDNHAFYYDANNLYGYAMSQPMPLKDYRWEKQGMDEELVADDENGEPYILSQANFDNEGERYQRLIRPVALPLVEEYKPWYEEDMNKMGEKILALDPIGDRGYVFEVDIEYPEEIHDAHNDMPFFAEKKACSPSAFTIEQMKRIYNDYNEAKQQKQQKLVMDLTDKKKYVVHYRMLQEALRHGLKLKAVHRVFSFFQSNWLKSYIDWITKMRALAPDEAAKSMWKLLANSIYGKTVEDVRRRREVDILLGDKANHVQKAMRTASSPSMKDFRIVIPNQLMLIERYKKTCTLNRPTIIGFTVLEESKLHMYKWWYDTLRPKFGDDVRLHYMDTDSTIIAVTGPRTYEKMYELQVEKKILDLSKIAAAMPNHPILRCGPCELMPNALGNFKDEMVGVEIDNAIFLRPKSYSIETANNKAHTRMKGVPSKATIPAHGPATQDGALPPGQKIVHQDFLDVWRGGTLPKVSFQRIGHTPDYQVETTVVEKLGLTNTDDKSFYFNAWECFRYGHYRIALYKEMGIVGSD